MSFYSDEEEEDGFHMFDQTIDTKSMFVLNQDKVTVTCGHKGPLPSYTSGNCMSKWQVQKELARGTQAVIFDATDGTEKVAIRIALVDDNDEKDTESRDQFQRDIDIRLQLCECSGFSMPKLKDAFFCNPYGVVVLEKVDGNIMQLIQKNPDQDISPCIAALSNLVTRMHQCGVIHRDLNYRNVLYKDTGKGIIIMLTDFETSNSEKNMGAQADRFMSAYIAEDNRSIEDMEYELGLMKTFFQAVRLKNQEVAKKVWDQMDGYAKGDLLSLHPEFASYDN